jgi:hypothetical protein
LRDTDIAASFLDVVPAMPNIESSSGEDDAIVPDLADCGSILAGRGGGLTRAMVGRGGGPTTGACWGKSGALEDPEDEGANDEPDSEAPEPLAAPVASLEGGAAGAFV